MRCLFRMPLAFVVAILLSWLSRSIPESQSLAQDFDSLDIPSREPWVDSRLRGSPEAPFPLSTVPAFPNLRFHEPMHVRWQPELGRYLVCELRGKIWSFPHDEQTQQADLVVDLREQIKSFDPMRSDGVQEVYSIALDPDFGNNRYVYVCMIFSNKLGVPLDDGSRISRFQITKESPPRIDCDSELPILSWLSGGHNGCDLAFDNSGCLLISTGDATDPSPPDRLNAGQDISNLLSSILRIDVRNATRENPYIIPPDNPFVGHEGAREEVWAYGFRNPWRMSVDPQSGALFVGDVGWEKWEMIHRVVRGGNYGWSVREGEELIQPEKPIGPTPILSPRVALSHAEAASITGGVVYRGHQLPSINEHYLFGDWVNGRIWAFPWDDRSPYREVANSALRIIAFELDRDGQPLVVHHANSTPLFRLIQNTKYSEELALARDFPKLLSDTGLFRNTAQEQVQSGVIPFAIHYPMWQDGAQAKHYLALPDQKKVVVYDTPQPLEGLAMFNSRLHYPEGAVLAKTLSLRDRRIETQVLYFNGQLWQGYSYVWNDEQTDAKLAPQEGLDLHLDMGAPVAWRIHSRSECFQCHNPWPESTLAFTPEQLHRPEDGERSPWMQFAKLGYIETLDGQRQPIPPERCVRSPLSHGASDTVSHRARSYLHANCAHCHQFGAGTAVALSLKIADDEAGMKAIDVIPEKGSFGLQDARLIAPGHPERSALLYRMASSSTGRMPHIGSREVDFEGVTLIARWIEEMQSPDRDPMLAEIASTEQAFAFALRLAKTHGSGTTGETAERQTRDFLQQWPNTPDPVVSSLFEAFLPATERVRRLSPSATIADLANMLGDSVQGRALFFEDARLQCAKCHQIQSQGGKIGPDLSQIGRNSSRSQLFESIVDPNRQIAPKYQTHTVLRTDGNAVSGILERETEEDLVLVTAAGETVRIPWDEMEQRKLDRQSLMPTGIVSQMTAQEMADLLAFLLSLDH
jgi:putative heme-binding domain-containing protein